MTRLWERKKKKHRIDRQQTQECTFEDAREALTEICRQMDVPRPMWLPKHEREFESFRMTSFLKDHFLEDVSFERMELEFIDDVKHKSKDPRNDFGF